MPPLKTVTHPSINQAWHTVTLLIETDVLPLSHTAARRIIPKGSRLGTKLNLK